MFVLQLLWVSHDVLCKTKVVTFPELEVKPVE